MAGLKISKRLIDEAHRRGLMVMLDVVYGPFGPEGSYSRPLCAIWLHGSADPLGQRDDYRVSEVRAFAMRKRAVAGCATMNSTACGSMR